MRSLPPLLVLAQIAACAGKDDEPKPEDDAPPGMGEPPPVVTIAGGEVVSGFATGRLRQTYDVPGFRITKHPITRDQFDACVDAGACTKVEEPKCALSDQPGGFGRFDLQDPKAPAVCVGTENAHAYCAYIGGRLPTFVEWELAARGPTPARYAWGDTPPTCKEHPRAERIVPPGPEDQGKLVRKAPCAMIESEAKLLVDEHADGASPEALQDVLLTPAELLATDPDAQFSACRSGFDTCLVYEREPARIDGVASFTSSTGGQVQVDELRYPYGFRCVVEEE